MRLIDADIMRENLEWCKSQSGRYNDTYWDDVIERLDVQPTVDAAPVVHGRWEDYGHCSCCGWGWSDLVYDRTEQMSRMNYCPRCGACMDLEEQDAQTEQSGK